MNRLELKEVPGGLVINKRGNTQGVTALSVISFISEIVVKNLTCASGNW